MSVDDDLIELSRDAFGLLVLTDASGQQHVGVSAVRAFPLSAPTRGVALCTQTGREVVWIDDLEAVASPMRRLIEEEIASNEFLPVITRIYRMSSDSTPCEFDVETNRGRTKFTLDSDEQIRKVGVNRLIITDARGVRYHVPDLQLLDTVSRRSLERHL